MTHSITLDIDYSQTLLTKNTLGNLFYSQKDQLDSLINDTITFFHSSEFIEFCAQSCDQLFDHNQLPSLFKSATYSFDQSIRSAIYESLGSTIRKYICQETTEEIIQTELKLMIHRFIQENLQAILSKAINSEIVIEKINKLKKLRELNSMSCE